MKMSRNLVRLKEAVRETREPYFKIWRLVVNKRVSAVRARQKGARRVVWLVDLPKLKQALLRKDDAPEYEILEESVAR
jgi:hypothetical protein